MKDKLIIQNDSDRSLREIIDEIATVIKDEGIEDDGDYPVVENGGVVIFRGYEDKPDLAVEAINNKESHRLVAYDTDSDQEV